MGDNNPPSVIRLEDIAFTSAYNQILTTLLLCAEHGKSKHAPLGDASQPALLPSQLTSKKLIEHVRRQLECRVGHSARCRLVREFFGHYQRIAWTSRLYFDLTLEPWVFLDAVLEDDFHDLAICVCNTFPRSPSPDPRIVSTIARRSPLLKALRVQFVFVDYHLRQFELLRPFTLSLRTLENLTSLVLSHVFIERGPRGTASQSILSCLGSSCPRLTHLRIENFTHFIAIDILALVLGERIDQIPDNRLLSIATRSDLHLIQVPVEQLAPFCSTIQRLELGCNESQEQLLEPTVCQMNVPILHPKIIAFLLRHLPKLERFDVVRCSVAVAVTRLASMPQEPPVFAAAEELVDPMCDPPKLIVSWTVSQSFPQGFLLLTKVYAVDIDSIDMMRAVGKACPNLKEVVFHAYVVGLAQQQSVSIDEYNDVFATCWIKVESVAMQELDCSTASCRAVLQALGPQLLQLTLRSCRAISVKDLDHCARLERLSIVGTASQLASHSPLTAPHLGHLVPKKRKLEPAMTKETFLPQLTRLTSDICLGSWSHLLEEKSTLTHLVLNCSHLDTPATDSHWEDAPELWPSMHTLRFRECDGLTITILFNLILPHMNRLEVIGVPFWMSHSRPGKSLIADVTRRFRGNVAVSFEKQGGPCTYGETDYCEGTSSPASSIVCSEEEETNSEDLAEGGVDEEIEEEETVEEGEM